MLFLTASMAPAAEPGRRTALVVGNERYESTVGALRNPANDARAVAATLRALGFSVIERRDLTRERLLGAMEDFRKTLPGAEIGLFYFAGHGLAIDGANYLVPVRSGFSPAGADDATLRMLAETRLFNAEQAVADMSAAGARCNLVILDACRTNRLPEGGRSREFRSAGGLVEMTPPAGSLIAFSTDAGRTAFDGDGRNGLYTEELLKNLATPGLTIEQVFKRTREAVFKRSEGGQLPAEYSRLIGNDVYLAGEMRVAAAVPVATPSPAIPEAADLESAASAARASRAAECADALRAIAKRQGPGEYAAGPIETLLEQVKDSLKTAAGPSTRVLADAATCATIIEVLPRCLGENHPRFRGLAAKAHNRRGDALLLLEKPAEALGEFDRARAMNPDDPYVLYNRGRANLALDRREAARADFTAATDPRFGESSARTLAGRALAEMK